MERARGTLQVTVTLQEGLVGTGCPASSGEEVQQSQDP